MREVACNAFHAFLRPLAKKGISAERMVAGTSLAVAELRSRKGRMDWSQLCAILENLRPTLGDDDFVALGRARLRPRARRFSFAIARLLFTPMEFYRWMNTPKKGAGNQVFTCVVPVHREVSANACEVDLTLADGYKVCWEFFLITRGTFEELPRMFGYEAAAVEVERLPNGARFRITVSPRARFFARVRRAFSWLFAARTAARELKAANEELVERYEQLEKTTAELTEYKENLEALVEERTRELREALDARQRFFANVSHELRTPLSLIMLAAADIDALAGRSLAERARADLRSVTDSARKLVRLVDELLLLAAAQEDKLALHREPSDLAALVRRLEAPWRLAAEAAGMQLTVDAPAQLVASVDLVAIERVASNLISNAVKYTPRGGRVEIVLADEPTGIRLSVLDDGPGIAEELAARLFGRFERAAGDARRIQGTGLGLFLVKQLVEAHGGTVAALARDGRGSELRVVLPASVAIRAAMPLTSAAQLHVTIDAPPSQAQLHFIPPRLSAGTILLAEDDAALAEHVARLLAERYTVFVAHDGARALELAKKHQPQLLVTDVDMPVMDGIELARRFRDVTNDRLAPIVMLSAVADLRTRVEGLEAGAVDYVTKPFDPLELSARVDAQFRTRDLAMRLHRAEQLSALGVLTSGLAHELRNPANGIANAIAPLVELLPPEVTKPGTPTAALLDVMSSCAEQVGFLARQLLGVRQGGELELQPTPLGELVTHAVSLSQVGNVAVRTDIAADRKVMCAAPLLAQVLANLVENGGHAAGPGGWVEVRTQRSSERTIIVVTDSGPGVPLELRERVFEPFFTTKPEGAGTGLGLSVARAIVQRHHGVLEIREHLGRTAFVVDLPDFASDETANAV